MSEGLRLQQAGVLIFRGVERFYAKQFHVAFARRYKKIGADNSQQNRKQRRDYDGKRDGEYIDHFDFHHEFGHYNETAFTR
jgi:hypothetical protein